MITEQEKNEIVKEIITGAVPEIVKAVKEELADKPAADPVADKDMVDYKELVRNAIK